MTSSTSLRDSRANGEDDGSDYSCDCTRTVILNDDVDEPILYAGTACQYRSTSFCGINSANGEILFCVNNGQCAEDRNNGCDCPASFKGMHCEVEDIKVPMEDRPGKNGSQPNGDDLQQVIDRGSVVGMDSALVILFTALAIVAAVLY